MLPVFVFPHEQKKAAKAEKNYTMYTKREKGRKKFKKGVAKVIRMW